MNPQPSNLGNPPLIPRLHPRPALCSPRLALCSSGRAHHPGGPYPPLFLLLCCSAALMLCCFSYTPPVHRHLLNASLVRAFTAFRPGARHRIIDARGVLRPMLEPADLPPDAPIDLLRKVSGANEHRLRYLMLFCIVAVVMLSVGFDQVARPLWVNPAYPPVPFSLTRMLLNMAVVIGMTVVLCLLVTAIGARRRGVLALNACLLARLCPSCGYPLRDVTPAGDTFHTCPECGGAWKLTR